MITDFKEAVRTHMRESTDSTGEHFRRAVRPLYGSRDGSRAEPIGSCLLLNIRDHKIVATAAHVIDFTSSHALYVVGMAGTEPVQLLGELMSTTTPAGGRDADYLDIGFWEVPESAEAQLGGISYFSERDLSHNRVSPHGRVFMAMGYPNSRNRRKVNNKEKTITPVVWKYSGSVADIPELSTELGITGHDHHYLRYEKYSTNDDGQRVSSVNPQGLSGGALFDLGAFDSIGGYETTHRPIGKLCGMIIRRKKKHQTLIAVKIQRIVEGVRVKYGE